jgi:tetratricopeptide (TPR) repeat protein
MLLPLKPLFKAAYLAWDPSEKCLRFLKWAEALTAATACYALSHYLNSPRLEPRLEREIQALGLPTFGTYLSILQWFASAPSDSLQPDLSSFLSYNYDSKKHPTLTPSVKRLVSTFSLEMLDSERINSTGLLRILLGARNKGIGHGGIPQPEDMNAIQEICKVLDLIASDFLRAGMLGITEIRADENRPGYYLERGIRWDASGEHPWEEQRAAENLLQLRSLSFLDRRNPVPAPPFIQVDQGALWFLQKYRKGGKSPFTDFFGNQPKNNPYWDDALRSFLEGRYERAGKQSLQISSTGVYHNLPDESDAYTKFIGRVKELENLAFQLGPSRRTHILALGGVGGVGKTALSRAFVRSIAISKDSERDFDYVVWVSAKTTILKEEIEPLAPGFADVEDVLDEIARVAESPELIYQRPFEKKKEQILSLLSDGRFLLVIDNFETVKNKKAFWEFMLEIPAPSKVLVTSRETFTEGCLTVQVLELEEAEALEVFRYECSNLGLDASKIVVSVKDKEHLIHRTGGIPLALKHVAILMVRGNTLHEALNRLGAKEGPIADFCFRETFKVLDKFEKATWIGLGIFQRPVALGELVQVTALPEADLLKSLNSLKSFSIVNRSIDEAGEEEFSCLPLTLGFAKKEMENWPPAAEMLHRYKQYRAVISRAGIKDSGTEAGRIVRDSKAVHPKLVTRELSKRAMILYRSGDVQEAIELIEAAERLDPKERSLWEVKAEVEMGEFRYDAARDCYLKLLSFSPYDLNALRQLVFIEKRTEHWDQAIEHGRRITQLPGTTKKDWHILGSMYYRKGRLEWEKGNRSQREAALLDAVECLRAAFYPAPATYPEKKHNVIASDTLARTYKYLGKPDDAEETILKGLEWDPYNPMLLELQSSLLDRPWH